MSFVGGLLGTAGGANGSGFASPSSANIESPTTVGQVNTAYTGNQNALAQQQAFLQAVQAQNGLGNQSSVYNQLQGIANGTGPNPAQAQLAQATGANVANQAALMAGQRGANANVGLLARQAAQQGSQIQQQSAGQAATLQAQQSLNAISGMGNIANTQAGQQAAATSANTQAQQNEQQQLLNSIAQQNNARIGMQSNVNSANAGLTQQNMQNQGNLFGGALQGAGLGAGLLAEGGKIQPKMYAEGQYVQSEPMSDDQWNTAASVQPASPAALPQAPVAAPSPGPKSSFVKSLASNSSSKPQGYGGVGQAIGAGLKNLFNSAMSSSPKASPSEDEQSGGLFTAQAQRDENAQSGLPLNQSVMSPEEQVNATGGSQQMAAANEPQVAAAKGGRVPALVSPGEQYLPPKDVKKVKDGKNPLSLGERIPGIPKHPGNDYRNDTVPKNLEEGGVVIPNKIMQSKNPHWEAMKFVHAHMAKGGKVPKKPSKK